MVLSVMKETELLSSNSIAISQLSKGEIQLLSTYYLDKCRMQHHRKIHFTPDRLPKKQTELPV